ncbi:SPOR domain-containing protein [uncultured Tenacibaculum sp.]|uniref:SPOR domain-containing protein n=1 Tax=uncultured Tenacibaculum sp. TaxID=174713 RepID=UPI00262AC07B|nr:SPOR domain-containing protein [uncultured Tenacibaculum sp.]
MKKHSLIITFILLFSAGVFSVNAQSKYTDNKNINSLIEKKRAYNKHNGTGYRIQLYYGLERRARSIRNRFKVEYPDIYTKLTYEEPNWKIQVGNYKTRLHADRALNEIREKFSGAIVVPM